MKRITISKATSRDASRDGVNYVVSGYGTAVFCKTKAKAKQVQQRLRQQRKKYYGK
jgi:hypothetical protein